MDNEDSQTKSNEHESRTQQTQSSPSSSNIDVPANTKTNKQREFSYQELVKATDNFKLDRYLGEGGFGVVYKGKLDNPNQVSNFLFCLIFTLFIAMYFFKLLM